MHHSLKLPAVVMGCSLTLFSCWLTRVGDVAPPRGMLSSPPASAGSWQAVERSQLAAADVAMLAVSQQWRCVYECSASGRVAVVTMLEGGAGPLASHQPQTCIAFNDFRALGQATILRVGTNPGDTFRFQAYAARQLGHPCMTVAHAWYDGQQWLAPAQPRLRFAGQRRLWRMQVTMVHPEGTMLATRAALHDFVSQLVAQSSPVEHPLVTEGEA